MRISDWSSDVCSSDLARRRRNRSRSALVAICLHSPLSSAAGGCVSGLPPPKIPWNIWQPDRESPASAMNIQRDVAHPMRSEEHTSELQSLMRISYAVFCLKKTNAELISTQHTNEE